jgi:hypothetical protein
MADKKKATFVLTDRLPCEQYFDSLLGLIVEDIVHPTADYCPADPKTASSYEPDDTVDTDVSTFLSAHSSASFQAELRDILGVYSMASGD